DEEEVVSERTVDAKAALPAPPTHPRSHNVKPGSTPAVPAGRNADGNGTGHGHGNNGNGRPADSGNGATSGQPKSSDSGGTVILAAPERGGFAAALGPGEERIRIARQKGYEGDPCPECGQLTLVRSGACLKCDTCAATTGCG